MYCISVSFYLVIKLNLHTSQWTGRYWVSGGSCKRIQSWHPHAKPVCQLGAMRDARRYGSPFSWNSVPSHGHIQDFRTQLSATDYGNFLANEPLPISTSTIADKATQILVDQFDYLRNNAVQPLAKFLEYITCVLILNCLTTTFLTTAQLEPVTHI